MRDDAWSYVGIDETNHGRYPEIFVAAYSNNQKDVLTASNPVYAKKRHSHKGLPAKLTHRGYSFVIITRDLLEAYSEEEIFGAVISSLIAPIREPNPLEIHIDGDISPKKEEQMFRYLDERSRMKGRKIIWGPKLDMRTPLVNLADETACWLFHKSLEKLTENPHEVMLSLLNQKINAPPRLKNLN